jgi:hypothetical protein
MTLTFKFAYVAILFILLLLVETMVNGKSHISFFSNFLLKLIQNNSFSFTNVPFSYFTS